MSKQKSSARTGGRSQRQLRVGEEIRHQLAEVFGRSDFRDPALADANITVTEVAISPDLKNATAYVMPLGGRPGGIDGEFTTDEVMEALARARPFLRTMVAKSSTMRYTPKINFILDKAFDRSVQIDGLLRDPHVAQDLTDDGSALSEDEPDGA